MDLGYLDKCILLAGKDGLDRQIEAVSVLEVPDGCSWIRGGELAVTALFGVRENPQMQVELVEDLAKSGGAGLVIFYTGRYLESLSTNLVDTADKLRLPLFQARDPSMTYANLIMPITEELTLRKFSNDVMAASYGVGSVGEFGACEPIAGVLSKRLGKTVVLLSRGFEKLEEYIPTGGQEVSTSLIEMCQHKYELRDYEHVSDGIVKIEIPSELATVLLCQVKDSQHRVARHLLIEGVPKGVVSKGSLAFVSIALRLYEVLHMQRERADRRHARYQSDFVADLLDGKLSSPDIIVERSKLLGLDMQDRRYVIVIVSEEPSKKNTSTECVFQALRTIDSDSMCLSRHNKVVAVPKCSEADPSRAREGLIMKLIDHINGHLKERIVLGVGLCQSSFDRLHYSYHEACEAIRLHQALPAKLRNCGDMATVVQYESVRHLALAEQLARNPLNRNFGKHILKSITEHDNRHGSELLDTMLVYIWEGLDTVRAAKRLFVHRNTLRYRLQTIRDLLQEDPFGHDNLPKYFLALCTTLFEPNQDSMSPRIHPR